MTSITKLTGIILKIFAVIAISISQHSGRIKSPGVSCTRLSVFDNPNYNEIERHLYLGNAKAAYEPIILKYLNITHVLTVDLRPIPKCISHKRNISNLYIKAYDHPEQKLIPYFPISNAFIDEGIKHGGVFVHCRHGISRSATLVIAYCMEKYNISYDKAYRYVKNRRSFIRPNPGFETQLRQYYAIKFNVRSPSRYEFFHIQAMKHKYKLASAVLMIVACLVIPFAIVL